MIIRAAESSQGLTASAIRPIGPFQVVQPPIRQIARLTIGASATLIRDKDRSPTAIGSRISARRRRLNDPVYDPFWQQARELDIPVAEHRGWLGYWLDRMDGHVEKMRTYAPWLKKPPREYFLEQCYLTMDPDESTLKAMVDLGVERNVLWGSDYPHFDCTYPGVLKEVRAAIEMLPEHARQSILTDNAIRFYNL